MLPILTQFKAETLLEGTGIVEKVKNLKATTQYKSSSEVYSFEDYYHKLVSDAEKIEKIELSATIAPGGGQGYLVTLTQALQLVTDKIEAVHTRALFFLGKLRSAIHNRDNLLATFSVWYQIAAQDILNGNSLKIPNSTVKALAESEFSRLADEDMSLDGMVEAVTVLIDHLKVAKKLAQEKYKIGTEQANASILKITSPGLNDSPSPYPLLRSRYQLRSEEETKPERPKYDDEDDELPEAPLTGPEDPDYVEHRQVVSSPITSQLTGMIEDAEVAVVDKVEMPEAIEQWRASLTEVEEDATETILADGGVADDPFLGEVRIENSEVVKVDSPTKVRDKVTPKYDDEDEPATPPPSRPKYDDEEDSNDTVTPPPTPQKTRTKIKF